MKPFQAALASAAFVAVGTLSRADPAPTVHYAPAENLEHIDVGLIDTAKREIDLAAYVLTDWPSKRSRGLPSAARKCAYTSMALSSQSGQDRTIDRARRTFHDITLMRLKGDRQSKRDGCYYVDPENLGGSDRHHEAGEK